MPHGLTRLRNREIKKPKKRKRKLGRGKDRTWEREKVGKRRDGRKTKRKKRGKHQLG